MLVSFRRRDTFLCNGREYVLRSASLGKEVEVSISLFISMTWHLHITCYQLLARADGAAGGRPFAVFRRDSRYSDGYGCIRIARHAIATSPAEVSKYTLLCDGQPTKLLDLALLADALYRPYDINRQAYLKEAVGLDTDQDQEIFSLSRQ